MFHPYEIVTKNPADRARMLDYLVQNGIDAKTHYSIAIHRQDSFPWGKDARLAGPLTHAEKNAASCISLPMFPELTDEGVEYVIGVVHASPDYICALVQYANGVRGVFECGAAR